MIIRRPVWFALLSLAVAPPLGGYLILCGLDVLSGGWARQGLGLWDAVRWHLSSTFLDVETLKEAVTFGYFFGAIPVLLAAIVIVLLARRKGGVSAPAITLIGGTFAGIAALLVFGTDPFIAWIAVSGALTAVVVLALSNVFGLSGRGAAASASPAMP